MQECIEQVAAAGARRLLLKTENPSNVSLYKHLGFHVVDQKNVSASGLEVWVFARAVAE